MALERVRHAGYSARVSSEAIASADPLPVRADADGVLRIGGTRVTMDVVVEAFDEGATPEEIAQQYSALHLADVYAVIAHVLRHRPEIDAYLDRRRALADTVRASNDTRCDPRGVRDRLLARRVGQ